MSKSPSIAVGTALTVSAALTTVTTPALAHSGLHENASLMSGLLHPLGGADHVAAMVAVGLWAALAGGRRVWLWPAAFVLAMLAGGLVGLAALPLPAIETGIAASVIVLGLALAMGLSLPVLPGALLIAAFAVFHGYAHGAEAPATGWLGYATGFALSTAALHIAGIGIGLALARASSRLPARTIGAATAALGVLLIAK